MSEKIWVGKLAHKELNVQQNLHRIALQYVGIDVNSLSGELTAAYYNELENPVEVISDPDTREAAKMLRVMAFMNYRSKENLVTKQKYKLDDLVKVYASTEVIEPHWVKHYMHNLRQMSMETGEKWMKVKEEEVTREELEDFLRSLVGDMGWETGYDPLGFIYFHLTLWACGITIFFPFWKDADIVVNTVNSHLHSHFDFGDKMDEEESDEC